MGKWLILATRRVLEVRLQIIRDALFIYQYAQRMGQTRRVATRRFLSMLRDDSFNRTGRWGIPQ